MWVRTAENVDRLCWESRNKAWKKGETSTHECMESFYTGGEGRMNGEQE
jgi:hypothetical protein